MPFLNARALGYALIAVCMLSAAWITKLKFEISSLNNAYASKQAEAQSCAASLSLQNAAIKSLQIRASGLNEDKIKSVSKIYIKDKSCESELRAYKMLFDSAF